MDNKEQLLDTALTTLNSDLAVPQNQPRTEVDLAESFQTILLTSQPAASGRFYVPDVDSPITIDEKDQHIAGPLQYLESEVRSTSAAAKSEYTTFLGFSSELASIRAGLLAQIKTATAAVSAISQVASSTSLQWMSSSDRFLDLSKVDGTASNAVLIETQTGGGVLMEPAAENNLTPSSITILATPSTGGLPGNNMELASLQDSVSTQSPAAGSSSALSVTQTNVGTSGGSGQEPTVSYVGNPDLYATLQTVLGATTDWFDWERIFVPPTQPCTLMGTAYVSDTNNGKDVDILQVTDGYGWSATLQNAYGSTSTQALVLFEDDPPLQSSPSSNNPLSIEFEIDMGSSLPLNQIEVLVRQVGGLWPVITSVTASSDNNTWIPLSCQGSLSWQGDAAAALVSTNAVASDGSGSTATGNSVLGQSVWQLSSSANLQDPNAVKSLRYLSVKLQQPYAYQCTKGIGHPYYVEVLKTDNSSSALFGIIHSSSSNTTTTRYAAADQIVNMAAGTTTSDTSQNGGQLGAILGDVASVVAGTATGGAAKTVNNVGGAGTIGGAVTGLVNGLLGSSTTSTDILQVGEYNDVFAAYRQVISVGSITVYERTFNTSASSQLVTIPVTFTSPFSAIRVLVDERIPSGTSILYEVSTDSGSTWQTIEACNIDQPSDAQISTANVLTLSTNSTTCQMRATLATTVATVSPSLLGYVIEVLPA